MSRSVDPELTTRIVGEVMHAAGLAEACSVVLDCAMTHAGLERALVVIGTESVLEAIGWGLPGDRVSVLLARSRAPDSPLAEALAGTGPRYYGEDNPFEELGLATCAVVSLPLSPHDGRVAVLIEAAGPGERVELVARIFTQYAPALGLHLKAERAQRAEARLQRQVDLLTGIINGLSDPVLLTDAKNNILLSNERAEQLLSSRSGDSDGRRRAIQINNLLFSSFLTQAAIGSREGPGREVNLVDPSDGSDLAFEVISVPLPVAMPATQGAVLSILRDITDLRRAFAEVEVQVKRSRLAEHRAREESDRLSVILENVGDPILVTDDQSNIIHMNREAERLFDVPVSFGADAPRRRRVRANDTKLTSLMSDFLMQPDDRRVEELELVDPETGRIFPAEVVGSKIFNARREPTAIVSVVHDLTQVVENERLARELQQLNEQLELRIARATRELERHNRQLEWQSRELEKASQLKSEFLANMSHELRTPLNAIIGFTAIVREGIYGELTGQQAEALEKVNAASQHLLSLINDVLDLAKIESGTVELRLDEVDLGATIRALVATVEPLTQEKGLTLEVVIAEDLPPVRTDRTKLGQILMNLLSNAVKFTDEGRVRVEATLDGGQVRICVADTGVGIQAENLAMIFDDFRQVDQTTTKRHRGTGLGLSITRKLVSLLEGQIHVESDVGVGSCFTIELPLRTGTVIASGD